MAKPAPDPNVTAIRYTSLADVKAALGIDPDDDSEDTRLTALIIAAELAVDFYCGRSFPDTDTAAEPEVITVVPANVAAAALQCAVATVRQTDAAFGVAGSEELLGTVASSQLRSVLRRSDLLRGYRTRFGFAGGRIEAG